MCMDPCQGHGTCLGQADTPLLPPNMQEVNASHLSMRFENTAAATCALYMGRIRPDGTHIYAWIVFADGIDAG